MNTTQNNISPVPVYKVGSTEFNVIASSVADQIKDSEQLWAAYLDFCQAKGFKPYEYLPKFAAHQVETSIVEVSVDKDGYGKDVTYGPFNIDKAMFAANVNLKGCPNITAFLKAEFAPYKIRTNFYVEGGWLNASVEIVGKKQYITYDSDSIRRIRDTLRCFGFGDIETVVENIADEPNGEVSIPTIASRTLP